MIPSVEIKKSGVSERDLKDVVFAAYGGTLKPILSEREPGSGRVKIFLNIEGIPMVRHRAFGSMDDGYPA